MLNFWLKLIVWFPFELQMMIHRHFLLLHLYFLLTYLTICSKFWMIYKNMSKKQTSDKWLDSWNLICKILELARQASAYNFNCLLLLSKILSIWQRNTCNSPFVCCLSNKMDLRYHFSLLKDIMKGVRDSLKQTSICFDTNELLMIYCLLQIIFDITRFWMNTL